ncbi:hypothetical protein RB195_014239 [Necator americanus]|uniref:Uncharacterized protein n=1 Tax=Necator americanus TaxID=51031 RepID=A0ABR1E1X4_NECAM
MDAFYDGINALMSKIPSQQRSERRTSDNVDLCEQMGLINASRNERNHRRHQDAARETVLLPRKKFAFAPAETKYTYNFACVARSTGDFNKEKRLRKKLHRQLQPDRDNEWTSRAMEFEKAWKDKNRKRKAYSGKMKRCSSVLNTATGKAVVEATLPI